MIMKIKIVAVGSLKEDYYRNRLESLKKLLRAKCEFEIAEVRDEPIPERSGAKIEEKIKESEAARILRNVKDGDCVCALCIEGQPYDEQKLAKLLQKETETERQIVFVIGGSLGLHKTVVQRADHRISFSNLTFPHQLMRVFLLESLRTAICDM